MKKFTEITKKQVINNTDNTKEEYQTITTYTIKNWEELTREEKEKEIEHNQEAIYSSYQDDLYYIFKDELENIKDEFKNIEFDDVYFDSSSQGGWIDKVKNFKVYYTTNIFGEEITVNDIDLHIRRYIEEITENDINIYDYYIDGEKLDRIKKTKKYQEFINNIIIEVNRWIDWINTAAKEVLQNEYRYPYNLDDPEDADYLYNYFSDTEFTTDYQTETQKTNGGDNSDDISNI